MKIAVMGAGGVGGYFGGRLAQAGNEVVFIARGKHLDALRATGLSLKSPAGDATVKVKAVEDPADAGSAEVVLFAVKLWDTETAAEAIRPLVAERRRGDPVPERRRIDRANRRGARARARDGRRGLHRGAHRRAGRDRADRDDGAASLRPGRALAARGGATFHDACVKAGINAELSDDIVRVLWEKFVLLVAISGTTSVARSRVGVVRADPDLRWLLEAAMRETWTVGRRRGVALADDLVAATLKMVDGLPAEMTSSMHGDLDAGGRLEAPWLSGAVARMAGEAGLEAPANRAIYAALKPFVEGKR